MSQEAYPAVIEKGATGFGAYFPDLPGCVSAGSTLAETVENAHEALALHIAGMAEDGESMPTPSSLETISPEPRDIDVAAILLIGVSLPGRTRCIEVAIDEGILDEIDRRGVDRSRFLTEAARAELARRTAG